jgi:hypothetical protein
MNALLDKLQTACDMNARVELQAKIDDLIQK